MKVFNLIALLGVLVIAICGGGVAWWWDRSPGFEFTPPIPIRWALPTAFKHIHLVTLAGEVKQARAAGAADARDLQTCKTSTLSLSSAIAAQNAAVEALRREGEARIAVSVKAVQAARAVAASERVHVQAILAAKPATTDLCAAASALIDQEASR